jgi:hypothetical protein
MVSFPVVVMEADYNNEFIYWRNQRLLKELTAPIFVSLKWMHKIWNKSLEQHTNTQIRLLL